MLTPPANDLFLRALACEKVERVPVWLMRQAGRYLPEYRKTRKGAGSFMALCKTPELACEVTLQPIDRFGFDAAILFSDILVVPDAMGCELGIVDGEGPRLGRPVRDEAVLSSLADLAAGDIDYQCEAARLCKRALGGSVPLIGFAGAPFTLACYMVDGSGGEFMQARKMMRARPDLFARLLGLLERCVSSCLQAQAEAGADVLMVFDSWAALAPAAKSELYLVEPLAGIIKRLRGAGCDLPVVYFPRGATRLAGRAAAAGVAAIGVDWAADLAQVRSNVPADVALQGNLDPAVLLSDPDTIHRCAAEVLDAHAGVPGHVFNLGHGVHKTTPVGNVRALVESVRSLSATAAQ